MHNGNIFSKRSVEHALARSHFHSFRRVRKSNLRHEQLYTEKLVPHPQVRFAFGLLKVNPVPFNPSEKSRVIPVRNSEDFESTTSLIPSTSITLSVGLAGS